MNYDIDHKNKTTITIRRDGVFTTIKNDKGLLISDDELEVSSLLVAMLHQTLRSRYEWWNSTSSDFKIELTIHEVVK